MDLCKIQICANCGQKRLTDKTQCDTINMLGRSDDRPNSVFTDPVLNRFLRSSPTCAEPRRIPSLRQPGG